MVVILAKSGFFMGQRVVHMYLNVVLKLALKRYLYRSESGNNMFEKVAPIST